MNEMANTKRGDMVQTPGGGVGLYVGTVNDVMWVCYDETKFAAMCERFDRKADHIVVEINRKGVRFYAAGPHPSCGWSRKPAEAARMSRHEAQECARIGKLLHPHSTYMPEMVK